MTDSLYTIKQGDTLWKIAGGDSNKINQICKLNNIQNPNSIFAGDRLNLSGINLNEEEISKELADLTPVNENKTNNDSETTETNEIHKEDETQKSTSKGEEYRNWLDSEENAEKLFAGKGNEIPEFEVFSFDRSKLQDKSTEEQAKIYTDKMSEFAQSIIDTVDNGDKDKKLNFDEYLQIAIGKNADAKEFKAANEIITQYDNMDEKGNNSANGKIEREELSKYVKDKYGKDIDNISSDEFNQYAQELTGLMAKSQIYTLMSQNFTSIAQNDADKETISKEEYATLLTMHDINWSELGNNSNKKVLDVVDGKLNFTETQTKVADPSTSDYQNQTNYLKDLFNGLFGKN